MKRYRPILLGLFSSLLVACPGPTPVVKVEPPKVTPTIAVHPPVPAMTNANVGAQRCTLQNVQHVGALARDGQLALGFGERGGLLAWSSPDGIRIKPVSPLGIASGASIAISYPKTVQPAAVAAVARGFALFARRVETAAGPCEGSCGDKPCPEVKPGEAAPQTCDKPTGYEYFVQLTDLDGKNPSAGRPFHTGLVDIESLLPGDGRAFGALTKNEVVWIQKRPDGRLDAERVELPGVEHVVPVFGHGPPAVLLVDKDGGMRLLDERGSHDIDGGFGGAQPKAATPAPAPKPSATPPKPGVTPPKPAVQPPLGKTPPPPPAGKPPVLPAAKPASNVRFRCHWGPKGRLEVSRQEGTTTQYAAIEKLVLRILKDSENPEIRESFVSEVEARMENGKMRRLGWDKRPVGDDVDVSEADPLADTARTRPVWSGSAFVFAHPSHPPHQLEAHAVGIVVATCGNKGP